MTELESKIWNMTHRWCDAQYGSIPDQNRRYLMDEIKALVLSNVVGQSEQLKTFAEFLFEKEYLVRRSVNEALKEFESL